MEQQNRYLLKKIKVHGTYNNMIKEFILENIRVQILSQDIVRIEYAKNGEFCDDNTLVIPLRVKDVVDSVAVYISDHEISFGDYRLYVPKNAKTLSGTYIEFCGHKIYAYKRLKNSGELPPIDKTPWAFALADNPRIRIPEKGLLSTLAGEYYVEEHVQDIYILLCKKDYKKLRELYVGLTGKCELPRMSAFGGWNSKYFAYSEETAKQLILDYEKNNIPLDNMVIDTDWRADTGRGIGYDINVELFPDIKRFMNFAHLHGVDIMFNDHPEPIKGAKNIFSHSEIAYREEKLQSLLNQGLDTWWYDRNWNTKLKSPTRDVSPETLGMYLYFEITRNFYQRKADSLDVYRRPMIMANVDNIENGRYKGIKSSISHRYCIQWTGDILSSEESLGTEIENMLKGGVNCIPFISADCGGHIGDPDKSLFIRWMQFGVFSPIFRPHCNNLVKRWRDPWSYDEETLSIVREYNKLRYRLLPLLYRYAFESYDSGAPMFRPLGWEFSYDKRASKITDSYTLGNNILIAPCGGRFLRKVERKRYLSMVQAIYYDTLNWQGNILAEAEYPSLDIDLHDQKPETNVPEYNFSAKFSTTIRFEKDVELYLCVDDCATVYIDNKLVLQDTKFHGAQKFFLGIVEGGVKHFLEIHYVQAGGDAVCELYYCEPVSNDMRKVYLPRGKWMNVFNGKKYHGGHIISAKCNLIEMPLYVRLGAVIPLAYESKNTKQQNWDKLVYDFYPDKESYDQGFLYEDDRETTAYVLGIHRFSRYEAFFDEKQNAFVIKLYAPQGCTQNIFYSSCRCVKFKIHLLKSSEVRTIDWNGNLIKYLHVSKKKNVFPLNTVDAAPDSTIHVVEAIIDERLSVNELRIFINKI